MGLRSFINLTDFERNERTKVGRCVDFLYEEVHNLKHTHTHIYSHIRYNTLIVIFNASVNVWIQPKKKQKPDISMITLVQTTKKKEKRNESHFYLSYISNTNIFTFIRDGSSSDEWFKVLQIAFVCCQFQPLNVYHLWST